MESQEKERLLIVGLGNPGKQYEQTRHNFGFRVAHSFALKHHLNFKKHREFKGEVAEGNWEEKKYLFLLPTTYMNLSGEAVKKVVRFYKIATENLIIILDDIALPFGTLRYRASGSPGGHNGLKSIQQHLGTVEYQRLKMGIGDNGFDPLDEYVLSKFTKEENEKLPEILNQGIQFLEGWLNGEHYKEKI